MPSIITFKAYNTTNLLTFPKAGVTQCNVPCNLCSTAEMLHSAILNWNLQFFRCK